ncbi:hypothetical protein Lbir_2821 [Legionella birminghamensis]|uniref:Uncharacterized protein n=2 Tax=Legionella birminghamensis TaxID=28083 RepID=A0A378I8L7_9GAMM|nr:hypothetical protein Lbir_2821 [Legionella birminghamensis]STX31070.1 Uncharacterised protein [Legionella birminghamensis]
MWRLIQKASQTIVDVVAKKTEEVVDRIAPTMAPDEVKKIEKLRILALETEKNTKDLEDKVDVKKNLVIAAAEELAIAEQEKENNLLLLAQLMKLSPAHVVDSLPVKLNSNKQRELEESLQQEPIYATASVLESLIEDEEFQQKKVDELVESVKRKKTPLTQFFKEEERPLTTSTNNQSQVRI